MRPEARPAAAWWASRLGRCHHVVDSMRTVAGMQANIAANLHLADAGYDDDTRDAFCAELEQLIDTLTPGPSHGDSVVVRVDWDPDQVLAEAALRAGVDLGGPSPGTLPVKTTMIIEPGRIRVKEGYGARFVEIWRDGEPTMDAGVRGIDTL